MSSLCLVALGRLISHVFVVCLIHFSEFSNFDKKNWKGVFCSLTLIFLFSVYMFYHLVGTAYSKCQTLLKPIIMVCYSGQRQGLKGTRKSSLPFLVFRNWWNNGQEEAENPPIATADRSVLRVSTLLARDAFITETITITLKYITRAKHNPISMKMIKDCLINLVLIIILLNCLRWHHLIFCIASLAIDRITSMSISYTRPCMRDLLNCSIKVLFGSSLC